VPIGSSVYNTQLYVLDENLQVLPLGMVGELYIGGVGLARGYYRAKEQTMEKFLDSPVSGSCSAIRAASGHYMVGGEKVSGSQFTNHTKYPFGYCRRVSLAELLSEPKNGH